MFKECHAQGRLFDKMRTVEESYFALLSTIHCTSLYSLIQLDCNKFSAMNSKHAVLIVLDLGCVIWCHEGFYK